MNIEFKVPDQDVHLNHQDPHLNHQAPPWGPAALAAALAAALRAAPYKISWLSPPSARLRGCERYATQCLAGRLSVYLCWF